MSWIVLCAAIGAWLTEVYYALRDEKAGTAKLRQLKRQAIAVRHERERPGKERRARERRCWRTWPLGHVWRREEISHTSLSGCTAEVCQACRKVNR